MCPRARNRRLPAISPAQERRLARDRAWHRLELIAYTALFVLVALAFSTNLTIQFTLPKLVVIRALAPVLGIVWAVRLLRNDVQAPPHGVLAATAALSLWANEAAPSREAFERALKMSPTDRNAATGLAEAESRLRK